MSKSLFPTLNPPKNGPGIPVPTAMGSGIVAMASAVVQPGGGMVQPTQAVSSSPVPGPNAFEVAVASYDPDAAVLVIRVKDSDDSEEVEAIIDLQAMTGSGTIQIQLGDSKLAPKIEIKVSPRVTPPKFATVEEAEQWMEDNA